MNEPTLIVLALGVALTLTRVWVMAGRLALRGVRAARPGRDAEGVSQT